jgi:AAA+ superfamily predicted ATPase
MSRRIDRTVSVEQAGADSSHLALLGQAHETSRALDLGLLQHAHAGLVSTARQLAARARWLDGDVQQRHLDLAERFRQQALRLRASAVAAGFTHPLPSAAPATTWPFPAGTPASTPSCPLELPRPSGPEPSPAGLPVAPSAPEVPTPLPPQGPSNLDEVTGAERVKRLFKSRFVHPLSDPARAALYKQRGAGGVLLYGPPGTGKTYIVRALARELKVPVFAISPSQILSKWFGESEKQLSALFEQARQHPAALIFVDEIDALAPSRDSLGDNGGPMQRMLTQLLTELDGFARQRGCLLFVGATNRPWALDAALLRPGRFDAIAYLGLPSAATRATLLRQHLQGVPQQGALDWARAGQALQGCSAAETVACAGQAARLAFEDAVRTGRNRPVTTADLMAAAQTVHRIATPAMLKRYADFAHDHGLPPPEDDDDPHSAPAAALAPAVVQQAVQSQAFEPVRFVQARDLAIEVETLPFMCYALQHAGIAPIRQLTIVNQGAEESQNLLVEVALVPDEYGESWRTNIAELPAGQRWQSGPISLPLRLKRLRAVNEKERAHLRITVRDKDEVLLARVEELPVLAYNEWVYLPQFLELAAAYIQPNSPALHPVVRAAAKRLQAATASAAFSGYQSGKRAHVDQMLQALHGALAHDMQLAYINPPPSFETSGQKVRLVADTLVQGRGTCLDLAILQAALWEHVGLHPLLVLVPGHALLACWMEDRAALQPVVTLGAGVKKAAAKDLEKALADGALRVFNSVEVTAETSLAQAERNGQAIVRDVLAKGGAVCFVDVHASRGSVTPLP